MFQEAVDEKLEGLEPSRFAQKRAEVDAEFEKAMAEEGTFGKKE